MKKQLFLIALIFVLFAAYSQEVQTKKETQPTTTEDAVDAKPQKDYCPHRVFFNFGAGLNNSVYNKFNKDYVNPKQGFNGSFELGYTYFFHKHWGISIGAGMTHLGNTALFQGNGSVQIFDPNYNPGTDDPITLKFMAKDFKEKQIVWAVEVPLMIQFEHKFGGKSGITAGLGVKGYFPIHARTSFDINEESIKLSGFDPILNVLYNENNTHFAMTMLSKADAKSKMRCSIDVIGELGGVFGISKTADFYIGAFASYGFLDIMPKDKVDYIERNTEKFVIKGVLNSANEKWNLFQYGIKFGFHFSPCKSKEESMDDLKRRYYNEMMKQRAEPIIVTNTIKEYYYFMPTISQELMDDVANNPAKKKAVQDLALSLSNTKILFDHDKAVPKLAGTEENLKKVATLLKENPEFKLVVVGYTSPVGSREYNKALAQRRADAMKALFIKEGVPADQVQTEAYTAEDPQHKEAIKEGDHSQQRAAIYRIEKK